MERHINYTTLPTALKIKIRHYIAQEWRGSISITETGNRFINIEFLTSGMKHVFTAQIRVDIAEDAQDIANKALQDVKAYLYDKYFKERDVEKA